jgi:hypothetical protein
MKRPIFLTVSLLLLGPLVVFAQNQPGAQATGQAARETPSLALQAGFAQTSQTPPAPEGSIEQLGDLLKPILIDALPKVLHESSDNWGHQVNVPVGLKWNGLKPSVQKSPRNHGEWKRLTITTRNLPRTLDLKIHDVKNVNAEKQTFKVFLTFQMGVEYEQQNWESGARLWSGSVRARAQVKLEMECENTIRVELDKNFLPDFIIRARATSAKLTYDKLVVEQINGVGGDAAKIIGAAVHNVVKQARPSIERDMLAKANAAIVKAADTKEIRVGFGSLLKAK